MYNHSYSKSVFTLLKVPLSLCFQVGLLCFAFTLYAIYESLFADLSLYSLALSL